MDHPHRTEEALLREIRHLQEKLAQVESSWLSIDATAGEKYSFKQLHHSLKNASLLAVATDGRGHIIFCNTSLAQLVGVPAEELLGKNLFEEIMPQARESFSLDHFLDGVIEQSIANDTPQSLKTRAGKVVEIAIVSVILHQDQRHFHGLTIVAEDRSDRESVRRKLVESNRRLDELYHSAFDLIQISDEQGKLLSVNRAWCEKLKYSREEAEQLHFLEIIHPQYRKVALLYWSQIGEGSDVGKFRSVFEARDGEEVHVSGSITIHTDEQGQTVYRGIFHDISDQVRAERSRNLYNSIANHTIHSSNLQDLFHNISRELKKVVQAEDFAITVRQGKKIDFSYWAGPQRYLLDNETHRAGLEDLVRYAVAVGKPLLLKRAEIEELITEGVVRPLAELPEVWIGIPLISHQEAIGLLLVQNQQYNDTMNFRDLELLDFVSGQVALAVDRKANEEKLNQQQSRQYAIFESSTHLVWSVDRDLKFTAFNRNFEKTLDKRYHVPPLLGNQYNDQYPKVTQNYLKFWGEKYQEAFSGKTVQFEALLSDSPRHDVWKLVFINPIYREDGTIREVSGIAHDITQRKKSEKALLSSEEKFRTIYESFQDIYFRCRLDGTLSMISPSVKELTNYETYDVLGKNITNYYLYDKRTKNLIRQLVKHKSVRNFEATIIKEDGQLIQCICNVRLVDSVYGDTREIEGVARDITELKKTNIALKKAKDEAERSLRIKESFLANMSHEIRTPMNGIVNMIHLLADTTLAPKQREYVQTVQDSSETLLTILNDILDLSKIEAGKMELQQSPVSIPAVFKKLYNLYSYQAAAKKVSLKYQTDEAIPPALLVDEVRLLQVLSNLTANAIKFTEAEGNVLLEIKAIGTEPGGTGPDQEMHVLKVTVQDNGIGISAQDQTELFKNFSQVDTSSSKRYQGTGLGLSIARQLVELMGGEIGLTSEVGQGSVFWFTFKALATRELPATLSKDQKLSFVSPGPRVMVVDDNAINRRVAREILENAGCTVTTVEGGEQAIAEVQQQPFDIVLMDIQMPDMNGVEATRQIRTLNLPVLPPIVAMTAYSMQDDKDKFMKAGLDEYISKPILPDEMLGKVASLTGFSLQTEAVAPAKATETDHDALEVISESVLEKLKKYGGEELVQESLQDFETEASELLDHISEAMQRKDYSGMLKDLHTLKGNSSTLGVLRVAHWAKTIETNLKENTYTGLSEDLLILSASFLEFQQTFRQTYKTNYHV